MLLRSFISFSALLILAAPAIAAEKLSVESALQQLAVSQSSVDENLCSSVELVSVMRVDLERYQNYAGLTDAELRSSISSIEDVVTMLAEIEWDFQDHGAMLPDANRCGLNYDRLATKLGY
ncbi:hypothetical protein [Litorimonas sp. WD9-15]|uniref:hypothetical protein n=1 Tax=Litorimonas sp. WD9-15 TaxID=3418716 RepID=UPI003CFD5773